MCRNITTLRGLEPAATPEEIEAAARRARAKDQRRPDASPQTEAAFERAVDPGDCGHQWTAGHAAALPPAPADPPTLTTARGQEGLTPPPIMS